MVNAIYEKGTLNMLHEVNVFYIVLKLFFERRLLRIIFENVIIFDYSSRDKTG